MSTTIGKFRPTQYGVEVDAVITSLAKLLPGEQVSYEDLTTAAGINVTKYRNILTSACNQLLRNQNRVFKAVRGFGLQRLDDEQITKTSIGTIKSIGRKARRAVRAGSVVEYDKLSSEGKVRHTVGMTVLNMMQHSSTHSSLKKIENVTIHKTTPVLPLGESVLAMFS